MSACRLPAGRAWAALALAAAVLAAPAGAAPVVPAAPAANAAAARPDPFAIPPRPAGETVQAAYFGIHLHHLVLRGRAQDPPQPTPFPSGLAGTLRLWDSTVRWADVQPGPGRWNFGRLDTYVATAQAEGAELVLTLGSTPRWAAARPDERCSYGLGCASEPADLDDWDRYVRTLARRYRGQIAWYEVWNEPHPEQHFDGYRGFYTGSTATLVELARRARAVLAEEDPAARLLTPGYTNRLPELDQYLGAGGRLHAQGLAYHLYAGGDAALVEQVRALRAILSRHGVGHWPILNTESSYERIPAPDARQRDAPTAAALQAHAMVLGAFLGVQLWALHGWDSEDSGAVDRHLNPTALEPVWRSVRRWLLGLAPRGCRSLADNLVRCDGLQPDGRHLALLWQPRTAATPATPATPVFWQPAAREHVLAAEAADGSLPTPVDGRYAVGLMPLALWLAPAPTRPATTAPR